MATDPRIIKAMLRASLRKRPEFGLYGHPAGDPADATHVDQGRWDSADADWMEQGRQSIRDRMDASGVPNPWSGGEQTINPNLQSAPPSGGPQTDLIRKILANAQGLDPDLRLRGGPSPFGRAPVPMTPSGPSGTPSMLPDPTVGYPNPNPPLVQQPTFLDRLRGGLTVPTTPIRHKNVNSRSFLRGLVGGIKGSGGGDLGGKSSGAAVGPDGLTAYQRANLDYRDRADKRSDELMRSLIGQRGFQQTEAGVDNKRADDAQTALAKERAADNARADAALALSRERLALARQNASRIGKNGSKTTDPTAARKAYWDAQADVIEAGINAKFEEETAELRPSSLKKRKAEASRDAAIQETRAWKARMMQTIMGQQIESKGMPNPEADPTDTLPDGLDEEDFDQ